MNSLLALHKVQTYLYKKHFRLLPAFIYRSIRVLFSCELPYTCELGAGTVFAHNGLGCVVHPKAVIGNNVKIYQNVTIGGRNNGVPQIGDNVSIYAGACVLGNIRIGNNAQIGANAVVIHDVPDNAVVGGVPAKIIKYI